MISPKRKKPSSPTFVFAMHVTAFIVANIFSFLLSLAWSSAASALDTPATEDPAPPSTPADSNISSTIYKLESVEIRGTERVAAEQLFQEFGLTQGMALNDDLVMNTRQKLLGLGLFRSVILVMKKGTKPGFARLIIECEDDELVLTDWALGGELAMTFSENAAKSADPDGPPRGFRAGLVGRNIFSAQHRAAVTADLDDRGILREGIAAYGLPRFAQEDTQFDAELHVIDPSKRYLNGMGFGARGQALWSKSLEGAGDLQYGMAIYTNRKPRFSYPGFPTTVTGPKIGYFRETRLRTFIPGAGSLLDASLLLAPLQGSHSTLELHLAQTQEFLTWLHGTAEITAMGVGVSGSSVRGEARFDVPLFFDHQSEDQAAGFMRFRGGFDHFGNTSLVGSAAILGIRYHSSGFIAELAIQITRSPEDLAKRQIPSSGESSFAGPSSQLQESGGERP